MKRIGLILVALFVWLGVSAQNGYENKFMRFYVPDCMGTPFPTSVDAYLVTVDGSQMYIKVRANFAYNASEYSYFQKYAIPKGNKMYLKLDSGDIITLTCSLGESVADGFITTKNGVYQNFADYSYFPIDVATIESLENHDIIKVRGQFKFEYMDGSMKFADSSDMPNTKDSFKQSKSKILKQCETGLNEKNRQKEFEENPLSGF